MPDGQRSPGQDPALLWALIEETPLVIYAKDLHGRFVLSNRQHATLLGLPPSDVLGRTDGELFGDIAADVDAATAEVLTDHAPRANEFTLPIGGEPRTYLETIFPLRGSEGTVLGVGGIATDITARRSLEESLGARAAELQEALEELHAAQDVLVQKEKLAALGSLGAAVAHEVNTPLGVAFTAITHLEGVLSTLGASLDRGDLTRGGMRSALAEAQDASRLVIQSVERAARLVQSFKQVAVDQSTPELRSARLGVWLAEIGESLRPLVRRGGASLSFEVEADAELVFAAGELQQVLTNLVDNAVTHAFPEGSTRPDPRRVAIRVSLGAEVLHVVVEDNGAGMPPEVARRALEPFFTTRRGKGGSGLGLHIANSIVAERFGGMICLDPRPGEGLAVHLELPLGTSALAVVPPTERA